jgi:hypothetical protein
LPSEEGGLVYVPLEAKARKKIHLDLKQPLDITSLSIALHSELAREFNEWINDRLCVHDLPFILAKTAQCQLPRTTGIRMVWVSL